MGVDSLKVATNEDIVEVFEGSDVEIPEYNEETLIRIGNRVEKLLMNNDSIWEAYRDAIQIAVEEIEEKKDLADKYAWDEVESYDLEALTNIAHDNIAEDLIEDEKLLKEYYENECECEE
jgi:uncharacterized membrane-anchored protein YjiN (DUF445 family)